MVADARTAVDGVIATCPVCRRSLALADRNGRHAASEVHYPRRDGSGAMVCSPPVGEVHLSIDGESRRARLRLDSPAHR